jgi:hypothetical protein
MHHHGFLSIRACGAVTTGLEAADQVSPIIKVQMNPEAGVDYQRAARIFWLADEFGKGHMFALRCEL